MPIKTYFHYKGKRVQMKALFFSIILDFAAHSLETAPGLMPYSALKAR